MHNSILKYISNNLNELKEQKLQQQLNKTTKMYKCVDKYVNDCVIKNPALVAFLLNDSSNKTQFGGGFDDIMKQKMTNLSAIFSTYNKLDLNEIQKKTKVIEQELDNILKQISDVESKNKLDFIVDDNAIVNNLEAIKIDTKKFSDGIYDVSKTKISIPPVDFELNDENLDSLIKKISDNVSEYEAKISDNNDLEIREINAFYNKINDTNTKIKLNTKKIKAIIQNIKKINEEVLESVKYLYNIDHVIKVDNFESMFGKFEQSRFLEHSNPAQHIKDFFSMVGAEYSKFKAGQIEQKDVIHMYNNNITNEIATDYGIPMVYFDGRLTQRVTNNFLLKESDIENKFHLVKNIIPKDVIESTSNKNISEFKNILLPNFGDKTMFGGADQIFDDVRLLYSEFQKNSIEYYDDLDEYKREITQYNINQSHILAHTLFQTLIITNQLYENDHVIYNYINAGSFSLYERIILTILNKIKEKNTSDKILYFKKYHYLTLLKLYNFIQGILSNIQPEQIIDIRRCSGETLTRFVLFNYFKDILESYHESDMDQITIYSRINDLKKPINFDNMQYINKKMFMSDFDLHEYKKSNASAFNNITLKDTIDSSTMYVNTDACDNLKTNQNIDKLSSHKFTEVFDSVRFTENGDITKHMSLDTQISKGKGICLMTYGYSGTGKTFTLFGDHATGKKGMLQSTLDNITGLKWVKFRLYELYGKGLTYPHYWSDDSDQPRINEIEHKLFTYNINVHPTELTLQTNKENIIESKDIKSYIDDNVNEMKIIDSSVSDSSTYVSIVETNVSDIFDNFDKFMDSIEENRKQKHRIRDTPNNIVSSRSILIYDFILRVGDNNVPMLILDLPGKEEIVESYINPYLNNEHILKLLQSQQLHDNYVHELKLMLMSMALNPIAAPIFAPDVVFDFINRHKDRKEIFEAVLSMSFKYDKYMYDNNIALHDHTDSLKQEINQKYTVDETNNKIIGIKNGGTVRGFKFEEEVVNKYGAQLNMFITINNNKIIINDHKKGFGYYGSRHSELQYKALAGIHFINRLIILNKFDILEDLFKSIIDIKLNDHLKTACSSVNILDTFENFKKSNFKGEMINNIEHSNQNIDTLKQIIKYDYYLTPLEGIYINENIAGLLKFLTGNLIVDKQKRDKYLGELEIKMKQPTGLNFQYQQKKARTWLISEKAGELDDDIREFYMYDTNETLPKRLINLIDSNGISYSDDNIKEEIGTIQESYNSNKIFNFTTPLITDVLKPYLNNIKDYKVFYLFGNYESDNDQKIKNLKCSHQYSLLENTSEFIKMLTSEIKNL